jgi:SAM-dependent methyltransferase
MDPFEGFKAIQKEGWAHFAALESATTRPAARLIKHARIRAGQHVLDVACGTGVVAVTAARLGARVTGLDLTPALLEKARENARVAQVEVALHEGDVEAMPFEDSVFEVVVSQFGHMFAPRPQLAVKEMLRVLKPGGTIAFSTWPPELFMGKMFSLVSRYTPPPPPGVSPPPQWGDPNIIRERLGDAVRDIQFDRDEFLIPTLSPQHHRMTVEKTSGSVIKLVESLSVTDPAKLAKFRREYEVAVAEYFADNALRQSYIMTRAVKV